MKSPRLILAILMALSITVGFAQNWTYVPNTGTTYILYGMHFPPGQDVIGYGGGMQGTYNGPGVITKTTDGGVNWSQIWPVSGSIDGIQAIWFLNDTVGFAGGWNNYFIKTTNGGTSWSNVTVNADVWYYTDIVFWDDNNGVVAAIMNSPAQSVFITSNGGDTWTEATSGIDQNVMGIDYADANTLFAVGQGGIVFKSTDGGHNWSNNNTLGPLLLGVDFADASFGVVGAEDQMFATNNGGATWTNYFTGYENFYATKAFSNGTAYIGGTDDNIYKTEDYGATWNMEFNGSGTSTLYRLRFTPNGNGFASGSQGTIIKYEPPFEAAFTADNTSTCEGNSVNFTDQSVGNIISWTWTFEGGDPPASTDQDPTVTYNSSGSFDVTLEVSDGSTSSSVTETDYIFVESIPVQASSPTGPSEACGGGMYDYTTAPIANADSYDWSVSPAEAGTFNGNGTTGTFTASSTWTGSYTVKVRGENECGNGPWSAGLDATLYFRPAAFQTSGTGGYCEGGTGRQPNLDGSETGVNYELFHEGTSTGNILPGTGDSLFFGYYTEAGFYTIVGFTDDCSENMLGECYIFLESLPGQPGAPTGTDAVCNHDTTSYFTSGASSANTYYWTLAPSNAGSVTSNGMTADVAWDFSFSGTVALTVTGSNDCGNGPDSDALQIEVVQTPEPVVEGEGETCQGYSETYQTEGDENNLFLWGVSGGEIIAGDGTPEIIVLWGSAGMGYVGVTEYNGTCTVASETFEVVIDECTIVDELTDYPIKIYPNPARDILYINLSELNKQSAIVLSVTDLDGKIIDRVKFPNPAGVLSLNISEYSSGIYNIKISDNADVIAAARFLVSR